MKISAEYLAGLYDGEGWITFGKMPSGYVKCEIGMSMAGVLPFMEELKRMFPNSRIHAKDFGKLTKAQVYKWCFSGSKAEEFVSFIEPHVLFKEPDLQWFRRWQNLPKDRPRNRTQETADALQLFIDEYKQWRTTRYKG